MNEKYDAVIIGAGIAGLSAGIFLAKRGRKTLICEQHRTPGGYVCGFNRGGYYFDGGVQSFGSYGMMFPLLREMGLLDEMTFKPSQVRMVGPGFDFTIESLEGIRDAFMSIYPEASDQLNAFFTELSGIIRASDLFKGFLLLSRLGQIAKIASFMMKRESRELLQKMSTWNGMKYPELVNKHFYNHEELCRFFTQICYHNASLVAYGGMWSGYLSDYWYPDCGMQVFADRLAEKFIELGGAIHYQARVEKIMTQGKQVSGVILNGGERIDARYVISAGDYKNLIGNLLNDSVFEDSERKRLEEAPVSESFVTLYLGVKRPAAEVNRLLGAHHVFYYPNLKETTAKDDPDYFKDTGIGIVSPTFENSKLNKNGCASLIIQTFADYQWMNIWGTDVEHQRNETYKDLKKKVGLQIIDTLDKFLPGIKNEIEVMEIGTPLTMEGYTLNSEGASAGWHWDPEKSPLGVNQIAIKTQVKNLLQCGHWAVSNGGVPSAALSGKMAADIIK